MDPLNSEFVRLLAKSGWSQSEAARRLLISAGVISQYVNGHTRPSLAILQSFKLLIGDTNPLPGSKHSMVLRDAPMSLDELENTLLRGLKELPTESRLQLLSQFIQIVATVRAQKVTYGTQKKSS